MRTIFSDCFEKCGFQELSVCHASGCTRNTSECKLAQQNYEAIFKLHL